MWLIIKWKFTFSKIGFADSKWTNLNAPLSYTPCVIHFWGLIALVLDLRLDSGKKGFEKTVITLRRGSVADSVDAIHNIW